MEVMMQKKIIYAGIALILLVVGKFMLQGDYIPFLQWWATVAYIGIVFMPLSALVFTKYNDKGYLFSKTIGIAIVGYLMWLLSSVHIMKFSALSCVICVIAGIILNIAIYFLWTKKKLRLEKSCRAEYEERENTLNHILVEEILFFALFLLFTYVRGFKPEAYGTEKFMDYGFMTSMMRSDYMPPQDFWFSGTKLNYYYVGQYLATFLTKLSFVKVNLGYNLALMLIGAFGFMLPFSLVYNLAEQFVAARGKKSRSIPAISAVIGGVAVCMAGNMHYPVYKWLEPAVRKFFGMEASKDKYWFPDATRFIGYHPETHDKTIHEFPCYSFVLGDLHAHVINIMFVVTVLGLLFAWMIVRRANKGKKIKLYEEVFSPQIIMISFFIGLFHTTNFWDFPIYFVVSGAVILFTNLLVYNFNKRALAVTALQGILVGGISEIVALPFTINFNQISTTPYFTVARTPLNQLIILWGLPVFTVIAFLCFMIADDRRKRKTEALGKGTGRKDAGVINKDIRNADVRDINRKDIDVKDTDARDTNVNDINIKDFTEENLIEEDFAEENFIEESCDRKEINREVPDRKDSQLINTDRKKKQTTKKKNTKKKKVPALFRFMSNLSSPDLFIITIGLCAIGLVLMPEIIYIKDIYSGDYKRANTMFKLTYQAFIMFGICFGYIYIRLITSHQTKRQIKVSVTCLVLFTLSVCYVQNAVNGWYGNIFHLKGYKGLNCTSFMKTNESFRDDVGAIDWLNQNVNGVEVVLEANGDSYTDYERVSVMTGLPTVLGWRTHEWLWKSDTTILDGRAADIETIYTSTDTEKVKRLLEKYHVSYLYVGKMERDKFAKMSGEILKSLGKVVYISPASAVKSYETYIVKIQH
jgi:Chlor_Arch_YYY domain